MDLAEYYEEVTKTAGLKEEADVSEEKVAAIVAVSEQFDIDGIAFENEDEKIAAAVAIVEGFESVVEESEKDAGVGEMYNKVKGHLAAGYAKVKEKAGKAYAATKEHLKTHKGKYYAGAGGAAAGGVAGYVAGRRSKSK